MNTESESNSEAEAEAYFDSQCDHKHSGVRSEFL